MRKRAQTHKTQLELKLSKLPETVQSDDVWYDLHMTKFTSGDDLVWCIEYIDDADNAIISITHTSLQACVDNTLKSIKNIEYLNTPEGKLMATIYSAHPDKFEKNSFYN